MNDSPKRLLSLDFFRGLAVIIVLLDHIEYYAGYQGVFMSWTPIAWGYSDASEGFVFISGFTFGRIYSRRSEYLTIAQNTRSVAYRCLKIYIAYQATTLAVVALSFLTDSGVLLSAINCNNHTTAHLVLNSLTLRLQPYCLQILPLYIVALPFMFFVLKTTQIVGNVAYLFPVFLYISSLSANEINFATCDRMGAWFFNPFSWQLLFTIAMCAGINSWRYTFPMQTKIYVLALSSIVLAFSAYDRLFSTELWPYLPQRLHSIVSTGLLHKSSAGLIRICHACTLAIFCGTLVSLLKASVPTWTIRLVTPIATTGQHSLFAYSLGAFLTYLGLLLLESIETTPLAVLLIGLDAAAITVAACYLRDRLCT